MKSPSILLNFLLLAICSLFLVQTKSIALNWTHADIGPVGSAGGFSLNAPTNTYVVTGAGQGMGGVSDSMSYVYQTASSDSEITVYVGSLIAPFPMNPYGAAGLVIRESLDPGAKTAALNVSLQDGANFWIRKDNNGTSLKTVGPSVAAPVWLRLQKAGNEFLAFISADGTTWDLLGRDFSDFSGSTFYVGFATSSGVPGTIATAEFEGVTLSGNLPYAIPNLQLWLRSDVGIIGGIAPKVAVWEDQTGIFNDAEQTNSASQPVWQDAQINDLPSILFDGNNKQLLVPDSPPLRPSQMSLFVVGRHSGGASDGVFLSKAPSNLNSGYAMGRTSSGSKVSFIIQGNTAASLPLATGTLGIFSGVFDGKRIKLSLAGGESVVAPFSELLVSSTAPLVLGGVGSSKALTGDIAEVLFFNRVLSASEKRSVESYLAGKYGVSTGVTASIGGGVYSGPFSVNLTASFGEVIYYTLDGSAPSATSNLYTGPISVSSSLTLRAVAYLNGVHGADFTANYVIEPASSLVPRDGLAMWLRADVGVIESVGKAIAWNDQSGQENGVANDSSSAPIKYPNAMGVHPVIRFNGSNQYLKAGQALNSGDALPMTFVAVTGSTSNLRGLFSSASNDSNGIRFSNGSVEFHNASPILDLGLNPTGSIFTIIGSRNSSGQRLLSLFNGTSTQSFSKSYNASNSPGNVTVNNPFGTTSTVQLTGTADDSLSVSGTGVSNLVNNSTRPGNVQLTNISFTLGESGSFTMFAANPTGGYNGYSINAKFTRDTGIEGDPIVGNTSPLLFSEPFIGKQDNNYFSGDLAEVLFYDRALSPSERKDLETYLSTKYSIAKTLISAPTASLAPGTYSGEISVTLNGPPDTIVHYTTDGSTPTLYSPAYTVPIIVASTSVIKAVAVKAGYAISPISTFSYVIDPSTSGISRSGLKLWLRSDTISLSSGSSVEQWDDQSGLGNKAVSSAPASSPLFQTGILSGKPSVRFDGSNDFLTIPSLATFNPTQISSIAVVRRTTGSGAATVVEKFDPALNTGFTMDFSNATSPWMSVLTNSVSGTLLANSFGILEGIYNQSQNIITISGGAAISSNFSSPLTATTTPFYLGGRGSQRPFAGDILEVLVYDRAISLSERQEIASYLFLKYGLGIQPILTSPVFSNSSSILPGPFDLTLAVPNGATVYYTIDGTNPTTSSLQYTGAIPITSTTTVKAIAVRTGFQNSSISQNTFTIDPSTDFTRNGLALWLKADAGVQTSAGAVTSWIDQSGKSNNASQSTSSARPIFVSSAVNSKPALQFNGDDSLFIPPTSDLRPQSVTVFVVGQNTDSGNSYRTFFRGGGDSDSEGYGLLKRSSGTEMRFNINGNNGTGNFATATVPTNSFGIMTGRYDQSQITFYLNGIVAGTTPNTIGITSYDSVAGNFIGSSGSGVYLQGQIAEVLVFNRALTDSERSTVDLYLYQRYNIGSAPSLVAPSLPPSNIASGPFSLAIPAHPMGATIRYEYGSTIPTDSSPVYDPNSPPQITATTTVNVKAFKSGFTASPVVSATYNVDSTAAFSRLGLSLWLRSDTGIQTSAGVVTSWADQSGNSNNAAQATSSARPTFLSSSVNSKPALDFDGGDSLFIPSTSALRPQAVTVFVVGRNDDTSSNYRTFFRGGGDGENEGYGLLKGSSGTQMRFNINTNNGGGNFATGTVPTNSFGVMAGRYDQSSITVHVNGVLTGTAANSSGITSYDSAAGNFVGSAGTTRYLDGQIAEVLVFNRALSDLERIGVEFYLYQRYNLGSAPQLPAPTLTPEQIFSESLSITMGSPASGSEIRYTLDGITDPSLSSPVFDPQNPPAITSDTTIKARAFGSGYTPSSIVQRTYKKDSTAIFDKSELKLWLRADYGVSTGAGNVVTSWADQSGLGNHGTQSTTSNQPIAVSSAINGLPVVRFDGSNDFLSVADSPATRPVTPTIYLVAKRSGGGNSGAIFYKSDSTSFANGYGFIRQGSGDTYGFFVNSNSTNKVTATVSASSEFLAQLSYNKSSLAVLINGSPLAPFWMSQDIAHSTQPLRIGGSGSGTQSFGGDIAEVLLFDRVLTLSEQAAVEKYLSTRYNLGTDGDGDGLPRWKEIELGTDPNVWDTNGNGLSDGQEYNSGFNPAALDSDGDGLSNAVELALGTNPFWADSDGDGVPDGADTYPLDPTASSNTDPTPGSAPTITLTLPVNATLIP